MLTSQSLFVDPPRRERITAISSAVQRQPIVLVLGMHRSGTSLCSHLLSALGVDMADQIPGPGATSPHPSNPRGHWERWEIVEFHDRILGLFNRGYLGPFHDFALPVAWWADPRVAQIRREIVAFLEKRMGDGYFGFKDPRTIRLMPMWHQIFNELKLAPKIVLCLRNPAQVARSLHARDGLDPANGEYRWLVHIIDFFRYSNGFDFCTVEYEKWFDNPSANFERLKEFLNLHWQQSEADLSLVLSDIIDPALRHDDPTRREASQPLVRTLYKLASRIGEDGTVDQISYTVSQFVSFQQLQQPFLRVFEDLARTAAKHPELEGRLTQALAEIDQQRTHIAELAKVGDERAEIESSANRLQVTLAERETTIAELSLRADELLAALQAAQAAVAAREAALERAEQEARERDAAVLSMQDEIAALRRVLAQAEQAGQERATAAEAMQREIGALRRAVVQDTQERVAATAVMRHEAAELRNALAQAERAAQEGRDASEAMQDEVAKLSDALAQAERAAQQSRDASEAMQGEVAKLSDALAQAEDAVRLGADMSTALEGEITDLRGRLAQAERETRMRATAVGNARAEISSLHTVIANAERAAQESRAAREAAQLELSSTRDQLAAARQIGRTALASLQTDFRAPPAATTSAGWLSAVCRLIGFRTTEHLP